MNRSTLRGAFLISFCLAFGSSLQAAESTGPEVSIHYRGHTFIAPQWPATLSGWARSAVETWQPLCEELGYRMDLSDDGRVLLLSSAAFHRSIRREQQLLRKGILAFERGVGSAVASDALRGERREGCAVLLNLRDRSDFESARGFIADLLGGTTAGSAAGSAVDEQSSEFFEDELCCAGWIEREARRAGASRLVEGLTRCLVAQRYGEPPAWLSEAFGRKVELELLSATRTTGERLDRRDWLRRLRADGASRGGPLSFEDFQGDVNDARALGLVLFLVEQRPGSLGPILRDLGRYCADRKEDSPPPQVLRSICERHAGGDLLADCERFFEAGDRLHLPRAR